MGWEDGHCCSEGSRDGLFRMVTISDDYSILHSKASDIVMISEALY